MESKTTCPIGLEAIITELAKIQIANMRLIIIGVDVTPMQGYSFVSVDIHDPKPVKREGYIGCEIFQFNENERTTENDKEWRKMHKLIDRWAAKARKLQGITE